MASISTTEKSTTSHQLITDKLPLLLCTSTTKSSECTSISVHNSSVCSSTELSSSSYSLPDGTKILENQVAGHTFQEGTNSIGLLKDEKSKTVLKPAGKPICAAREIGFYKSLEVTKNQDLINVKNLVPEFKGTAKIKINGKELDFIRLEDLTYNMSQPCIIDIKIGKRTWDPEATLDKIKAEEEKYSACKKSLGLCIPGFQVYSLINNKLMRFSKDYGKKLNPTTFIDTLKLFLNYDYGGYCKELLMEILINLWNIQKWSRTQKSIKLYSSSILILYDAKRLKHCINNMSLSSTKNNGYTQKSKCKNFDNDKILNGSIHSNAFNDNTKNDTITTTNTNFPSEVNNILSENHIITEDCEKQNGFTKHSTHINYCDTKISSSSLSPLKSYCKSDSSFVRVKMIDFAHVFSSIDNTIDKNYLFGIENLVRIFEGFLNEISHHQHFQQQPQPIHEERQQ